MPKVAEYNALEAQTAEQLAQLYVLKNNAELKRQIVFKEKLCALMADCNFSLREIILIIDPSGSHKSITAPRSAGRKPRLIKHYKNPSTGELIENNWSTTKCSKPGKQNTAPQPPRAGSSDTEAHLAKHRYAWRGASKSVS